MSKRNILAQDCAVAIGLNVDYCSADQCDAYSNPAFPSSAQDVNSDAATSLRKSAFFST